MENKTPEPFGFLDNPSAPDVFADGAAGIVFFQGNIRLTFESVRVNHVTSPGPATRVVIGRLVLPLAGAEGLKNMLIDYLDKIKNQTPSAVPIQGTPTLQ